MKKVILFLLFSLFCMNLFSQQFTINEATINASHEISQRLPIGNSLAVLSIKSLSDDLTLHIIGLLETGLVHSERLQIVSRQRIQTVMNEQNFGMSGYVDDNTAQRIGRLLGARLVLTGEIIKPENRYFFNIQVLETETAIIMYSKSYEIRNSELRNYEQLILLKQRQERMEREQLIREEERRQRDEINRINAQERKRKWNNLINIFTPNIDFGNWTPFSPITFEIEYNYLPDMPLGFSIGTHGLYTSWNFFIPNYSGYDKEELWKYDGDGKSTFSPENYRDRGNRTYEGFEWVIGYRINLITGFLMLPFGLGANHTNELRLFDYIYSSSPSVIRETEWFSQVTWSTTFVAEIGLQLVLGNYFSIGGTYRLRNFNNSTFTINAGIVFLNK